MEDDPNFMQKPKKALVQRLYKNFSVGRLESLDASIIPKKDASVLSQFPSAIFGNMSSVAAGGGTRLVPKITMKQKRLDPIETRNSITKFEEGLTIDNGKFIIHSTRNNNNNTQAQTLGTQPRTTMQAHSNSLFKDHSILHSLEPLPSKRGTAQKLEKLDAKGLSDLGRRLTDDNKHDSLLERDEEGTTSIMLGGANSEAKVFNQQQLIKKKSAVFINGSVGKSVTRKGKISNSVIGGKRSQQKQQTQQQQQQEQYLTPQDFIQLIRTDPEMADEFTYLNKQSHAYDFKIVDFDERNKQEYMTISARGITHFVGGEATFMTIEEWEREARMFHQLLEISFFKMYKKWKSFSLWKKLMRRSNMKKYSDELNAQLFSVDKTLQPALLRIRELCLINRTIAYADLNVMQAMRHEEFRAHQESYRLQHTDVKLDTIESSIRDVLVENCKKSLIAFKEENRIPMKDERGDDIVEEQAPLLVGDETGKEMPFTQEATIRTHYKRLHKFVRLVDYLVLDSKIDMMNNSTEQIAEQVQQRNEMNDDEKNYSAVLNPWIIVECSPIPSAGLSYLPNRDTLKSLFEDIVQKSIIKICQKHKLMVKAQDLQQYFQQDRDEVAQDDQTGIQELIFSDAKFVQHIADLKRNLDIAFDFVEKYARFLLPFVQRYEKNTNLDISEHFEKRENEAFRLAIRQFSQEDEEFQNVEGQQELGLVLFDNNRLKDKIKNCAAHCLRQIEVLMPRLLGERAGKFFQRVNRYNQLISYLPTTVEQFVRFNEDVITISNDLDSVTVEKAEIEELDIIIEEFKIKCPEHVRQTAKDAYNSLKSLRLKLEESLNSSDQNLTKFRLQCERMAPSVNLRVKELSEELQDIPYAKEGAPLDRTVEQIVSLSAKLREVSELARKIMEWQVALQAEVNSFEKLGIFQKDFSIIERLWLGIREWRQREKEWAQIQFQSVDMDEMALTLERLSKTANVCAKELEANPNARNFKQDIDEYKNVFQTLQGLTDKAMTPESWAEVRDVLFIPGLANAPFHKLDDPLYTVGWIIKYQLQQYREQILEIALKAAKEADLKRQLEEVKEFWRTANLNVAPYKGRTDVFILDTKANEDLISRLDDTMLKGNNILGSRFVEGIRTEVEEQMRMLRYTQELLDEWYSHQRNWTYLEPILSSQYAQKNMAKEVKAFSVADVAWKKMMKRANDLPALLKYWAAVDFQRREYHALLARNNAEFEKIQKALEELLEKKRDVFQRFYFLSNDELLEILSQAKDLQSVVPHLRKCFENLIKLRFDQHELPTHMVSAEGEAVPLRNFVARGDEVEQWFKDLEEAMKGSLKTVFRNAALKYDSDDMQRRDWVLQWPCQVVLGLDAVFWTKITEENYLGPDADGDLYDWFEGNQAQLNELTELINGPLTEIQRRTLSSLAVQDVHYRDIVEEMANEGVESVTEFKWQMQLRLYTEEEAIFARQVTARLPYCYEYLGSTTRLVITPLTDRCWMTITGALGIQLGAAPAGPAGTGKTESCKDLAKVLGKYCLVYNCSDQVNVKMMEKLFMGLCQTGSWTCLDEFNRIDIEVLSVIAQQVLTIREALLDHRERFEFFGKSVTLAPTADMGIFTTMNPGYAGRTELPDNLKVLFRPVAMMVPDYTLIAEIMLFSEGFSQSRALSRKMTKLYKLSSEQLSQQDHYDFGMRAVKSVLVMAGGLKRAEPTAGEDLVLIRAMRDSNVPKFLAHDIPLFNAIVQDLFPGLKIPPIANPELELVVTGKIEEFALRAVPSFVEKVLQFHETLKVRFGVMIVGPTMSGKSACLRVLREAYNTLSEKLTQEALAKSAQGENLHAQFQTVHCSILNPKAISMEELYGDFDALSQSWTDGLASTLLRDYSQMEDRSKKWVCFDGPVDAIWIENMNSVLDDSMTLCLSNGERIKLKPQMRMLFEVQDLAVASPATVSRCGMVYMDQEVVGYRAIVASFFEQELDGLLQKEELRQTLRQNLTLSLAKLFANMKKAQLKQAIATPEANIAVAVCRNIKTVLVQIDANLLHQNMEKLTAQKALEKLLLWAFAWGCGGTLTSASLPNFEKLLTEIFSVDIAPRGSIFDYYYSLKKQEGDFLAWTDQIPEFVYDVNMSYFSLVVPTKDTVCYSWFLARAVEILQPVFLTGLTGTGKTIIATNTLSRLQEEGSITSLSMTFSAKTSSSSTQFQIEGRLQSQRKNKRIILMPPPGKRLAIFVDDINMPAVEKYGAQPPIELLRQYVDYKGVYDRKALAWKDISESVLVVAAAPPGGGRSNLTPRFTRHFSLLNVPDSNQEVLSFIFSQIVKNFLHAKQFKKEIIEFGESNYLVSATLQIYEEIQQALLPTPAKSHYVFNLRDVSKVFQGILQAKPRAFPKTESFVKLWLHETCRVFHDRLIDDTDRSWFLDSLVKIMASWFKTDWNKADLFEGKLPLIMCSFLDKDLEGDDRVYQQVSDYDRFLKTVDQYMLEDTKLTLVLFRDAIEHMSRVARVLALERGHFMLVGVGGSGKKSLTTMASALSHSVIQTIEPRKNYGRKEWREDLFRMMKRAAFKNQSVVFMFDDQHILQESFAEDVNNLLNAGEVPNLLGKDEWDEVANELANESRQLKYGSPQQLFQERVRNRLHVVLTMSPVGGQLRVRMRMFPSLVNCTTIDWLNPWPEEALLTVARLNLESLEFDGLTPELRESLALCCVHTHQSVERACEKFFDNLRRKIYITPKSYIDLLAAYKTLLKRKHEELSNAKQKLSNGLFKLREANSIIVDLKQRLTELQPVLDKKSIEIEEMITRLTGERKEASVAKGIVTEEEAAVNEQAQEIQSMKDDADRVLQAALPMLKAANEALNILDRKVVSEIKSNNNPNPLVLFTLECVAILFDEKTDWDSIKRVLSDPNILTRMKTYDVNSISTKTEQKVKSKIAGNPEFTPAEVKKKSEAAQAICQWVLAVANFTDVNKEIQSKKAKVAQMDQELERANTILRQKQSELKKVVDKVEALERKFNDSKSEQERLVKEKQLTVDRLQRAEELSNGLADEQIRWKETVERLDEDLKLVLGNVFVAASSVAYYGPFTGLYRDELVDLWLAKCEELEIRVAEKYSLASVLADAVTVRNWNAKGLPSDSVSVNNGVLVYTTESFPLVIDPQLQASKWIKNLEGENGLRAVKITASDLLKIVELCVRQGNPLLIEDVEENLEPLLEPLVTKQFKIVNRRKMLRLGDSDIEYDERFRLFFQTKLANPSFLPDVFIRVAVINFTVTDLGLAEQLLADVVVKEMPEVEQTKNELIVSIATGKTQLKRNEDKILELLTSSKGMILDDVELIENLKISKKTAFNVKQAVAIAEEKQVAIDQARSKYEPVAQRGSTLFFVIADLALIDPMYQFSLTYFKRLFSVVIEQAEKSDDIDERVRTLIDQTTIIIFLNVCRGLFNDHKKIFSFLVASAISLKNSTISRTEWSVFNRGVSIAAAAQVQQIPLPQNTKLNAKLWKNILSLRTVHECFGKLANDIIKNTKEWQDWIFSREPHQEALPKPYEIAKSVSPSGDESEQTGETVFLTPFQFLLLVRTVREEKSLYAMSDFVERTLGSRFTAATVPTMEEVFADTDHRTPLIFILSQGADPQERLIRFSKQMKILNVEIISLGQGQGPIAERAIDNGTKQGGWVVLQNCHLGKSFMPTLEKLIDQLETPIQPINTQFRLILTSMPCDYFPVGILQNGVKLTNEPPKGLKANMMKSYGELTQEKFEECSQPRVWKKLLFSLAFFHANVQERRRFGPLGWNIRYEFNDSDLDTGMTILKNMIEANSDIPWQALRYVIGEITYGGRVTDDWDRRTLKTVLGKYLVEEMLENGFKFSESGLYQSVAEGPLDQYREVIRKFPEYESPEVFGMHDNANITFQLKESNVALTTVLSIQPRETSSSATAAKGGSAPKTTDQIVEEMCTMFEQKLPPILKKPEEKKEKAGNVAAPKVDEGKIDPLKVCCEQECERFNRLLAVQAKSLEQLKKAIKGEVVMSGELDKMYQQLINNQVPDIWKEKSYPSLKPLASWFEDFVQRVAFFKQWQADDQVRPKCYWLPAFFFPQGFLTSVLQNYARTNLIAIDILGFTFRFLAQSDAANITTASETGANIYGLFLEGCQFDSQKGNLEESAPAQMFARAPVIEFIPTENTKSNPDDYAIPVYKTTLRAGTLSTTGHSTNFILAVDVPTKKKPQHWIMRGAALVCMLND